MALQRMTMEHVPAVCEIHRSSWGENEVSVKLGESYLKRFYNVDSEMAEDYDLTVNTDKLSAAEVTALIVHAARAITGESAISQVTSRASQESRPSA